MPIPAVILPGSGGPQPLDLRELELLGPGRREKQPRQDEQHPNLTTVRGHGSSCPFFHLHQECHQWRLIASFESFFSLVNKAAAVLNM